MFLKHIIGYAEQYVLARRCVKSRFGGGRDRVGNTLYVFCYG